MSYINVGARYLDPEGPINIKTKKALKEALRDHPDKVKFYGTSPMGPKMPDSGLASDIPAGHKLIVCGPDPYTRRDWFANVELVNGTIKVS